VEFSIVASSSNTQRMKMATLVQDDLSHTGMRVHIVPLDFRAMLDRVFQSFDYDAAIMGLGGGDPDPNPEMNVWLSTGATHLWHLNETKPATTWEREIDDLMQQQMVTLNYRRRKRLYDRVQELISENLPFVFLATPDVLVGAKARVGNFHPTVLDDYALWNADELYLRTGTAGPERAGIR
jgi:peptide/nickel transport system substrate-binding protein